MADIEVRSSGTRVTASMSDRIIIRLRENATTGYRWSVREVDAPLEVESSDMVAPEPLVPGAAGERVVVVRPTAAGRARVSLQLKRAWESDPIDRFDLDVEVG